MTSQFEGYIASIHMTKTFQQNTSSKNEKKKLVKKQHAMLNVEYVSTVPKMLTILSAPVPRFPLGIIYQLDTT